MAIVLGYECDSCGLLTSEVDKDNPLYECGCGVRFSRSSADGHRCPECGHFASRVADYACPECDEGELDEKELYQCEICRELFDNETDCKEHLEGEHPG